MILVFSLRGTELSAGFSDFTIVSILAVPFGPFVVAFEVCAVQGVQLRAGVVDTVRCNGKKKNDLKLKLDFPAFPRISPDFPDLRSRHARKVIAL